MRRDEEPDEIVVAIIDEEYTRKNEETYLDRSAIYRRALECDFGHEFEESNIGPGFDIPAFVTVLKDNFIPLLPWAVAIFFSGKSLIDNTQAWLKISDRIRKYFSRKVVLNRNGAAVIAVEAVLKTMDGLPRTLRLKSYRSGGLWEVDEFEKIEPYEIIEASPPILNMGMSFHLFEIEADGVLFLVGVHGKDVLIRPKMG